MNCTKISPEFECQGRRSRSAHQGQKNELSAADTSRVRTNAIRSLQTACSSSGRANFVSARGVVQLCRRQFYAGGKISACCLAVAMHLVDAVSVICQCY